MDRGYALGLTGGGGDWKVTTHVATTRFICLSVFLGEKNRAVILALSSMMMSFLWLTNLLVASSQMLFDLRMPKEVGVQKD